MPIGEPVESSANLPNRPAQGDIRKLSPTSLKQGWTLPYTPHEIPFMGSGPGRVLRGNQHYPKPHIVVDVVARVAVPIGRTAVNRMIDPRTTAQPGDLPQHWVSTGEKTSA